MARVVGWSFAAGALVGAAVVVRVAPLGAALFVLGCWVFVVAAVCVVASEAD